MENKQRIQTLTELLRETQRSISKVQTFIDVVNLGIKQIYAEKSYLVAEKDITFFKHEVSEIEYIATNYLYDFKSDLKIYQNQASKIVAELESLGVKVEN